MCMELLKNNKRSPYNSVNNYLLTTVLRSLISRKKSLTSILKTYFNYRPLFKTVTKNLNNYVLLPHSFLEQIFIK